MPIRKVDDLTLGGSPVYIWDEIRDYVNADVLMLSKEVADLLLKEQERADKIEKFREQWLKLRL